jgi:hypothetical protein
VHGVALLAQMFGTHDGPFLRFGHTFGLLHGNGFTYHFHPIRSRRVLDHYRVLPPIYWW